MNKIIFGGAFDPIHNGHIEMALTASIIYDADVIFVPSKIAIWKDHSVDKKHKKKMVELAISPYKRFSICEFELNSNDDYVYSIDTVKHLKSLYPNDNLFFLIGYDQADLFHKWKDAKLLSELVKVVVYKRPDYELDKDNVNKFHMDILEGKLHDISSSEIREFKKLDIPYELIEYIEQNDLYYIPRLKNWYQDRYIHVHETAKLSYKIAQFNGKNCGKAYIAGFLHDLGKMVHIDDEKQDYSEEHKSLQNEYKQYSSLPKYALHQVLGAFYAKKDYEIEDEEILNAILFHCTGRKNMDWLEKIVYEADKIEPSREYDSSNLINVALTKPLEESFVFILRANKEFIDSKPKKSDENELSQECFKFYL